MGSLFDSIFGSTPPRHTHDWILIDKTEVKPVVANLKMKGGSDDTVRTYQKMMQGYVIFVFKCSSCGEVKTEEH